MPRTGGIYSEPAGTKAVSGQTVKSVPYNSFIDDLVTDANAARPVTAGGTGATTASGARTALGVAIGTDIQAHDATLDALAAYNTNGIVTQTAADTFTGRTITGTANQVTVANGGGVAGNPTLSLDPTDVRIPAIITAPNTGLHVLDTDASHDLIIAPGSNITADRTLTLTTGDADRTLDISAGSVTITAAAATVLDDASTAAMLTTLGAQPLDSDLTAIAALVSAANKLPYATGSGTWALTDFSAYGRTLVDDADATTARATLGVTIGSQVQAYSADLAAIAGLTSAANKLPYATGSGTWALADFSAYGRTLVDDADAATARGTLGLGTVATRAAPSGTIVGTSDIQSLTNKSFEDITTIIYDNGDSSKQVIFECQGISTGTQRVATFPDANFTFVGTATTQTLTNKTLTSPAINGATLSGTLSGGTFTSTTLTSPTISSPTVSGTFSTSGTLTLSGTFSGGTLNGPTISGAALAGTLSGTPTYSGKSTYTLGNSTGGQTYIALVPSDRGAGKPELDIIKTTTAGKWQIQIDDGSTNAGATLDVHASSFTWGDVQIADISTPQTLTNKTVSGGTISGTVAGSPTLSGTVTFSNSPVAPTPTGTDNSTNVATTAFVQGLVGPGSYVKIASNTISGSPASVVFSSIPSSGYSYFIVIFEDVVTNVAATTDGININVSTDNGSTWHTTSGDYIQATTTARTYLSAVGASGNTSTFKHSYSEVRFYGLGNSSRATMAKTFFRGLWQSTTTFVDSAGDDCARAAAEADNAIRFISSTSSTLQSGTITLYGIKS